MKKTNSGSIELNKITYIENSRMRGIDEVADLMGDIQQRGLLEPIGIRIKDNALIFGNRRVKAFEKLNYSKIDCDFYDDMSDEELLMTNLAENLKRKSIGSIEIGRMCLILKDKGMSNTEISQKLDLPKSRVDSAVASYNITIGTEFEKLVRYKLGSGKTKAGGIAESLIWKIQNSITRARKLSKSDWKIILREIEKGNFISEHIPILRRLLLSDRNMDMNEAMKILDNCDVSHLWLHFNTEELNKEMTKTKHTSKAEYVKHILRKQNERILV